MGRIINFDNYTPSNSNRKEIVVSPSADDNYLIKNSSSEVENPYKQTLDVLAKSNPNKIVFSIQDAADVLGIGEEFIRRRIKSGKIKATYLGDKPFINIVELARISIEGV